MAQQTAVEWLAKQYNYITWMRNRDEISAGTADKLRGDYLEQAKRLEREQIIKAHDDGDVWSGEKYYNETYGTRLQNETN